MARTLTVNTNSYLLRRYSPMFKLAAADSTLFLSDFRDSHVIIRFLEKIRISSEHFCEGTPCWDWMAYIHPVTGYGQFKVNGEAFWNGSPCWDWTGAVHHSSGTGLITVDGKTVFVPPVAYEYFIGQLPEGYKAIAGCQRPRRRAAPEGQTTTPGPGWRRRASD